MLGASAEDISLDLLEYGEESTAGWILSCSDDEFVRVLGVADWLVSEGPSTPSGASMMLAKACALAAVYVHEGAPRELVRSRRAKLENATVPSTRRWPNYALQQSAGRHFGLGDDARRYWGTSG